MSAMYCGTPVLRASISGVAQLTENPGCAVAVERAPNRSPAALRRLHRTIRAASGARGRESRAARARTQRCSGGHECAHVERERVCVCDGV